MQAYLGEGLGPLSWLTDLHIPHPGRVAGQQVLKVRETRLQVHLFDSSVFNTGQQVFTVSEK